VRLSTRSEATRSNVSLSPGRTYCFQARAEDYLNRVGAWSASGNQACVQARRQARLATTNAKPVPVTKGKRLTVTSTLTRAVWGTQTFQAHPNQPVKMQFRTPTGAYATVQTARSNARGQVSTTVTAKRDGCFRLPYAGDGATTPAVAGGDCVDLR
jgi:hypothetical protein